MLKFLNKKKYSREGFTLIELLLAVTIMAVIGTGIYTTFAQGLRLWRRAIEIKPDIESNLVFEKTASDLRNLFRGTKRTFKGEEKALEFFTYSTQDQMDRDGHRIKEPVFVRYRYDASVGSLMRSEESFRTVLLPKKEADDTLFKPMGAALKDCSFEYYHEDSEKKIFEWKSFWKDPCPPKAVRVSLRYDDGNKTGHQVKILSVPAGGCAA